MTRATHLVLVSALAGGVAIGCDSGPLGGPTGAAGTGAAGTGAAGTGAAGTGAGAGTTGTAGSGASGALDCAWLEGDNCWKQTAAGAEACLPPETESGVLAADHKTCTYVSGATVIFASALALPPPDDTDWNFTIANRSGDCLHFESSKGGMKLTVHGQTVTETAVGAMGIKITCPDGKTYSNTNAFDLFDCNSGGSSFGGLPGNAWSSTAGSLSVTLLGGRNDMQLFSCQTP